MSLKGYYHNELERVDKASQRVREVMDGLSPAFFIGMMTVDGVLTYANRTALAAIGLERKDVVGRRFEDTPWWSFSASQRQQLRDAVANAANGKSSRFDVVFQDTSGYLVTIDFTLNPVFDGKNNVAYLVPSGHDVTERRLVERALRMLNECNHLLLRATDVTTLMHDVCRLIVEVGGYSMAWVGEGQQDEVKTIKPITYAGTDSGILSEGLVLTWAENDPRGQGVTGRCMCSGEVVICEDVQLDPAISPYLRDLALKKGFRGGMAFPLYQKSSVRRVLTISSRVSFKLTSDEVELLQNLARNLAYGIENLHTQRENKQILAAVYKIAEGISISTGAEFLQKLVLMMTEVLGAQVGIITQLQSAEHPYTRTVAAVIDGKIVNNFDIVTSGTPCENLSETTPEWAVLSDVTRHYPSAHKLAELGAEAYIGRRIADAYGQSIGQIFLLFRQPLQQPEFVSSIFRVFTARVAAELQRQEQNLTLLA